MADMAPRRPARKTRIDLLESYSPAGYHHPPACVRPSCAAKQKQAAAVAARQLGAADLIFQNKIS
jgi:hypothetical protein